MLTKKAAAGAFSDDDYARLDEKKRSDIIILAETERLPRALVSVRKDLSPALADRLEKILLSMHENDQGRKILKNTDDHKVRSAAGGGCRTAPKARGNLSVCQEELADPLWPAQYSALRMKGRQRGRL